MGVSKVVINRDGKADILMDLTNDTISSESLVVGFTAHDKTGEVIEGVNPYVKADTDATVNAQSELIQQIKTALEEKAIAGSGGSGATVGKATASPTANSTSISFTGLTGQPKMFAVCPTGNVTFNTSNRFVVNVMYDGNATRGIYAVGSGSWNVTYTGTHSATYFTWTYSNGTLTITTNSATNGGYFASGVTYQLAYAI